MNVSADYASPAAIRPMLYGRSPRRSFIYSSADPQLRICRCPGACSIYIRVRIRGIRIFILRSMLFSHPTIFIGASAAAIFCQPMLSASAFARRSVPDKQYPTVDARSPVTLREPRHRIGGKTHVERKIEIIYRLDKSYTSHLKQIVKTIASAGKTLNDTKHKAEITAYQLKSSISISLPRPAEQLYLFFLRHLRQLRRIYTAYLNLTLCHNKYPPRCMK